MTFPLWSLSADHRTLGLVVAVAIGFAFGFVLERVGFGRAPKLIGQFHGTDMSVLKVIFTAIVTAMLGAIILSGLHVLDLEAVSARYPTFLWPAVIGGVVLGAGFALSGYCPGTSFVGLASGKLDALVTVVGLVIGAIGYSELQAAIPALDRLHGSGNLGRFYLWQLLHVPPAVIGVLVAAIAALAFVGAESIERALKGVVPAAPRSRRMVFAGFAVAALIGVLTLLMPARSAAQACPARAPATAECRSGPR